MAIVLLLSSLIADDPALAQTGAVSAQVTRQTTRQISSAIAARISQAEFTALATEEREGGFSAWYSFAYNNLSGEKNDIELHAYGFQNVLGGDFAFENFYLGGSVDYSNANAAFRFDSEVYDSAPTLNVSLDYFGVTPYLAYVINDSFFLSLLAGYGATRSETERRAGIGSDFDSNAGFYDGSLTFIRRREGRYGEALEMKISTGFRHAISKSSGSSVDQRFTFTGSLDLGVPIPMTSWSDSNTRAGSVEPYGRVWYEASFDDSNDPTDHTGYAGAGVVFALTEEVSLDLGGWTNFGDPDFRAVQADASVSVKF